ncbi:MAG: glucose-6-phosphate isomerase [Oscillospiraceae bacterium]|jgi:glucose-6-phosphate isomerase|nr:glucose-6-phosphate isomerase [Oscillospiraceae bacterium]
MKIINTYLKNFIGENDYQKILPELEKAHNFLINRDGLGNDMLGWLDCFKNFDSSILETAERIKESSEVVLILGVGGSYLGAKAAFEFLNLPKHGYPKVLFLGNSMSAEPLVKAIDYCKEKSVYVIVISKSGNTLETAIAFRVFRDFMNDKYGVKAKERILILTEKNSSCLQKIIYDYGYGYVEVPKNVGGRFSFFTAASLLPLAVGGADIGLIIKSVTNASVKFSAHELSENPCLEYVAIRNILNRNGKKIEVLASFEPRLNGVLEWWKQLFGESEGKDGKGIFPTSVNFSTDLHSLGQFLQDGTKILFETMLISEYPPKDFTIKPSVEIDGLEYLEGKSINFINSKIFEGTIKAHSIGGTPCTVLNFRDFSEESLAEIIFFFEKSCAISGYILGVNPFDQPGVESYKQSTLALLK